MPRWIVPAAWKLFVLILLAAVLLPMTGCASQESKRWLSEEEDAAMRAYCEPVGGCALVPVGLWEKIESLLGRLGGQAL